MTNKYLVISKDNTAFCTDWYTYENCWNPEKIHCVVNTWSNKVTFDGEHWLEIEEDHL